MEKRQVVNIINFIRDCEPRCTMDLELTVRKEIELMQQYNLRGTFLLQYDAVCDEDFVSLIRAFGPEKVLFGTDYPMWDPVEEVAHFMQLPLTDREREMILWDNGMRILK